MSLRCVLHLALVALSHAATAPTQSGKQNIGGTKACNRQPIKDAYDKCLKSIVATAVCDATMKKTIESICGVAPTAGEEKQLKSEAARKALAACKMASKSGAGCDEKFREVMGTNGTQMNAKDRVKDSLDAVRGANTAVASAMADCKGSKESCKEEMMTKLSNMKGRNLTKGELDGALRDAGASAAGGAIKACLANASSAILKDACLKSSGAKDAFAKASGRDPSQIKDTDLKKAAKFAAVNDVSDALKACLELATADATAKKACFSDGELKQKIAGAQGGDVANVKDSKVRDYVMKGARDDVLAVVKTCNKTADKSQCLEVMRDLKAKSMGKAAADVTNDHLTLDARQALKGDLGKGMTACMEGAASAQEKADCRNNLAKSMIKAGDIDGQEPTKGTVEQYLRDAAKSDAGQVLKDCTGTRDECMKQVKGQIGKVMGRNSASDVSTKDAEMYSKMGAIDDAKDQALSCVQAKKESGSTATCDDLYTSYKNARKQTAPSSVLKQKQQKSELMLDAVAAVKKGMREVCFEKETKALADACMKTLKEQDDDVAKEYLKGEGSKATAKVLASRTKLADSKATTSYLGERFGACMKTAAGATEKKACVDDMDAKRLVAGVKTSQAAVLKKYRASVVAEAATLCNSTERSSCIESAKADMIAAGLKEREFNMLKKLAELTAAAEVYASCTQSDSNASDCMVLAKEEFEAISGADSSVWAKVKAKVVKLADDIQNGEDIVMKKKMQLLIDAMTSGTKCINNVTMALVNKIKSWISVTPALTGFKAGGCRLVDGKAEYSAMVGVKNFTEVQIDAAADTVNAGILGSDISRRLLIAEMRRLATVSTVYTAQEIEACGASDATCGQTDTDTGGSGSTTGGSAAAGGSATTGSSSTSSAMQCAGIDVLMVMAFLALALMK
jgi:hypothetical protein